MPKITHAKSKTGKKKPASARAARRRDATPKALVTPADVARVRAAGATGRVRRKNLNIDQGQLDAVQELYGVATETEAVALALGTAIDRVAFAREAAAGVERLGELGPFAYEGDREDALDFSGFDAPGTRGGR